MTTSVTPRTRASRRTPLGLPWPDRAPWEALGPDFIRQWGRPRGKRMPEHLSIYGQTGSGKSYFEQWVLRERARARGSHIVILATKPADKTLTDMQWPIIEDWPPGYGKKQVIYWAKQPGRPGDPNGLRQQRASVMRLLDELWVPDSNWILACDELAYLVEDLRLRTIVTRYYREGRALGLTMVATTQRPAGVVRQMHSEAGWKVVFAPEDEEDTDRMAQVLGNRRHYREVLPTLDRSKYEFLIVRKLTGEAYISSIPAPPPAARKQK